MFGKEVTIQDGKQGIKLKQQTASDDLSDNENYIVNCLPVNYCIEWPTLYHFEGIEPEIAVDYPFVVTADLKYPAFIDVNDDLNIARLFVGIKENYKDYREPMEIGLYMGRLYIRDFFDSKTIAKENLVAGIKLVLTVIPQLNGKCKSQLEAIDQSGSVLSMIRTSKYLSVDWKGRVSTGAHIKTLKIEGTKSAY